MLDFAHFLLKHIIGSICIVLLTIKNLILDTKFMSLAFLDQRFYDTGHVCPNIGGHL